MNKFRMDSNTESSENKIHTLGLGYIYSYLDSEGYTIYEVNTDPHHHFQILAKLDNDFIMVAIRAAYHPEIGAIDETIKQLLLKEAEKLDAIPHVARLSVAPLQKNNLEIDGINGGTEYRVTFNGLTTL